MSQIKNKTALNLILIFSIFALVSAYFVQYILGHKPCNLCLISRGLRFFIVAYFSVKFGKPFVDFLEKKGGIWFSVVGIIIIILFLFVLLIFK